MTNTIATAEHRGTPSSVPGNRPGAAPDSPDDGSHPAPSSPRIPSRRRRRSATLPRGDRPGSVPSRLRLLRAAVLVTASALGSVLVAGGMSASGSWSDIRDHSAPQVSSATGLYFALGDMDAQLANQLMTGGDATSATLYDQRRDQAAADLRDLAQAATGDKSAERNIASAISDLGAYEELAARALLLGEQAHRPAGHANARTVTAYTSASHLMRTRLLPEADRLVTVNNSAFEHTYRKATGTQSAVRTGLLAIGLLMLALLAALQFFLAGRFRRILNPGTAAATALALTALITGLVHVSTQQEQLRAARHDAFDSVVALTRARAISYDANADESRYLLDRAGATAHERDFLTKSQQLMRMNGATIATYDADLATALRAYRTDHADLRFTGHFGDEFRNVTFPGEREAAERVLTAYQTYQRDDRTIRSLASSGKVAAAIAYCTSHATGDSNYAFDAFDKALRRLIAINTHAFERTSSSAAGTALTEPLALAGGLLAAACLVVLGLRPRLAEFR